MKTVNIKGKEYVPVNERLKQFRKDYPTYSLRTELVNVDEQVALVKAVIRDDKDRIIAEGTAHERADQKGSIVNSTSHVENAETSAWGRALGNLGIGIDASVATADEVANAIRSQEKKEKAVLPTYGSTVKQQGQIQDLVRSLGLDLQKDILDKAKWTWPLTSEQAEVTIKRLNERMASELSA
jgi:hypothetical protein